MTTLPLASSTDTCTAGAMLRPPTLLGCVVNATLAGVPAVTTTAAEPLTEPRVALTVLVPARVLAEYRPVAELIEPTLVLDQVKRAGSPGPY